MAKTTRHTFVLSAEAAKRGFTGFIDMLRYDNATVIDGSQTFIVLQTTGHSPTTGRWNSFGLYILAETTGDYPDTTYLKEQARPKLPLPRTRATV